MMELYIARVMMNSNILSELFKETMDTTLQLFLISDAEMLNILQDIIDKKEKMNKICIFSLF